MTGTTRDSAVHGNGVPVAPAAGPGSSEWRHILRHADLPAVAEVRRQLRARLDHWGARHLAETAELLTSELVTNALVHTDRDAELTAVLTGRPPGRRLRVEVHDFVGRGPRLRAASDHSVSGRGLLLVQALADAWGVWPQAVGKVVWFELDGETP